MTSSSNTKPSSHALILIGHGSHVNADSARPVLEHLNTLLTSLSESGAQPVFDEIWPAFWKEEPFLHDVLSLVRAPEATIVPLYISQGYFWQRVSPRELGFTKRPETDGVLTQVLGGKLVHYTQPVGIHDAMTRVVEAHIEHTGVSLEQPHTLLLLGHGTNRHKRSSRAIYEQAQKLDTLDTREVLVGFLDEDPSLEDVFALTTHETVVIVPYFMAEGLHTREDIPRILGLMKEGDGTITSPQHVGEKTVWYTPAVGMDPAIVHVILELAQTPTQGANNTGQRSDEELVSWLRRLLREHENVSFGEVTFRLAAEGDDVELRHREDRERQGEELRVMRGDAALFSLVQWADDGSHRPLKSAPTLRKGWSYKTSIHGLPRALDIFYPTALRKAYELDVEGEVSGVMDWDVVASRQSGKYAPVKEAASDDVLCALDSMCRVCCLRDAMWYAPGESSVRDEATISLPCTSPCGLFLERVLENL